jgi:hypothetical protein
MYKSDANSARGSNTSYPNTSYPNTSYPNTSYPNTSYPNTSYPNTSYPNTSYPNPALLVMPREESSEHKNQRIKKSWKLVSAYIIEVSRGGI